MSPTITSGATTRLAEPGLMRGLPHNRTTGSGTIPGTGCPVRHAKPAGMRTRFRAVAGR